MGCQNWFRIALICWLIIESKSLIAGWLGFFQRGAGFIGFFSKGTLYSNNISFWKGWPTEASYQYTPETSFQQRSVKRRPRLAPARRPRPRADGGTVQLCGMNWHDRGSRAQATVTKTQLDGPHLGRKGRCHVPNLYFESSPPWGDLEGSAHVTD